MNKKEDNNMMWYAILKDEQDNDWGTGSFDKDEAIKMAKRMECKHIATIDANYDENGNATTDGECVEIEEVEITRSEKIRKIAGISRAEFSKKYNIPVRTLENWDAGKGNPPEYVLDLLERVVKEDMNMKGFNFAIVEVGCHSNVLGIFETEEEAMEELELSFGESHIDEYDTEWEVVKIDDNIRKWIPRLNARYYLFEEGADGGNSYKKRTFAELKNYFKDEDTDEDEKEAWSRIKDIDDLKDFIENFVNNYKGMHCHDYYIEEA